jgi:thymidylate synthase (FAD)
MKEDYSEVKVLDKGVVKLLDYMGSDHDIAEAARVSYKGEKLVSKDRSLIRYLVRNGHSSPLEMAELKFYIKCPIFVARQWIRHRCGNYNEKSLRYTTLTYDDFYLPDVGDINYQSEINNQGRGGVIPSEYAMGIQEDMNSWMEDSVSEYLKYCEYGVARELSRIVLPLSTYTEFVFKMDLKNLLHFLKLRMDSHAQYEIRVYANAIAGIVKELFPITYEAFEDYVLGSYTLSRMEIDVLRNLLSDMDLCIDEFVEESGMSKREISAFKELLTSKLNIKLEN